MTEITERTKREELSRWTRALALFELLVSPTPWVLLVASMHSPSVDAWFIYHVPAIRSGMAPFLIFCSLTGVVSLFGKGAGRAQSIAFTFIAFFVGGTLLGAGA